LKRSEAIIRTIEIFIYRVKRNFRWVRECLWHTCDWDASSTFTLMLYHLKQVQISMMLEGLHQEDEKVDKALYLAIRLLTRLDADDYVRGARKRLDVPRRLHPCREA
jgi:hypothetical protein